MSTLVTGRCRLCGEHGPLSYEHVPPESTCTYRGHKVMLVSDAVKGRRYTQFQQGLGAPSLCQACNCFTNENYVSAYREWAQQCRTLLDHTPPGGVVSWRFHVRPFEVAKQIAAMAVAVMDEDTIDAAPNRELRRFVQDPTVRRLPRGLRLYCYLVHEGSGMDRFVSGCVVGDTSGRTNFVNAEIAVPPIGYVVAEHKWYGSDLPELAMLCPVTEFSRAWPGGYKDVDLTIRAMPTNTPFPLDYRAEAQIVVDGAETALQRVRAVAELDEVYAVDLRSLLPRTKYIGMRVRLWTRNDEINVAWFDTLEEARQGMQDDGDRRSFVADCYPRAQPDAPYWRRFVTLRGRPEAVRDHCMRCGWRLIGPTDQSPPGQALAS